MIQVGFMLAGGIFRRLLPGFGRCGVAKFRRFKLVDSQECEHLLFSTRLVFALIPSFRCFNCLHGVGKKN